MQPQLCKNCEHTFQGNFCSNCGQKTHTVRLNFAYLKEEIKYTFLHINKGFLYTVKQLFTRPGDTIREFIEGKRVQHYKPILLLFVLAGVNGLLMHFFPAEEFIYNSNSTNQLEASKQIALTKKTMEFVSKNFTLIELILLPIYAFCSWLAFKKFGYNYIENIIINCFATSQRLLISIFLFPLQYLLLNTPYFILITFLTMLPSIGFTIWLILQLYKKHNAGDVIVRMLLFLIYISVCLFIFITLFAIVFVYLLKAGYIDKSLFVN